MDTTEYRRLRHRAYDSHRGQLQQEEILVGSRASWLVTSQALLLGTYVFLVNTPFSHLLPRPHVDGGRVEPNLTTFPFSDFDLAELNTAISHLRAVFQGAGFIMALAVTASIRAAFAAMGDVLESYSRAISDLDAAALGGGQVSREDVELTCSVLPSLISRPAYRLWGGLPAHLIGPLFATVWSVLFLSERDYEGWSGASIVLLVVFVGWTSLLASRRFSYPLR